MSVFVDTFVMRTISEFDGSGVEPAGQIVAFIPAANRDPSPAVTTRVVPDVAGEGAVATSEMARFLCVSNVVVPMSVCPF